MLATILSAEAITEAMYEFGIFPEGRCADNAYCCIARDWLEREFAAAWKTMLGYLPRYEPEAHDCDDFARACACYAQMLHAWTPDKPAGTALGLGEFSYRREDYGSHRLNCALVNSGSVELVFFEPQLARVVPLTRSEVYSCTDWRF
jgi:hypothetical protein